MKNVSNSRALLIEEGTKALLTRGYDGVGLNAILAATNVPKGSFYHFFRSKDEFVLAILDVYEQHYILLRESFFADTTHRPMNRIRNYFYELERLHSRENPTGGCLFGVIAGTISIRSPTVKARLKAIFATWNAQLEPLVYEAQAANEIDPLPDAKEIAASLIEAYQGALIRMKVDGQPAAFRRFRRFALDSLSPATHC